MNYVAHCYLSGDNPELLVGNFMGDFVRGNEHLSYSETIQNGVMLHRNIDWYTDSDPVAKECKKLFAPRYHKYAGVVTDILWDHFLTKEWEIFSDKTLDQYIEYMYDSLLSHYDTLPENLQKFLPGFFAGRWIEKYATLEGFEDVLIRMSKTTTLPTEAEWAIETVRENYDILRFQFFDFFPKMIDFVQDKFLVAIRRPD